MGFFGKLFDFNHDGHLDSFEKAADFGAFMHMMDTSEKEKKASLSESWFEDEDEEFFEYDDDDDY